MTLSYQIAFFAQNLNKKFKLLAQNILKLGKEFIYLSFYSLLYELTQFKSFSYPLKIFVLNNLITKRS